MVARSITLTAFEKELDENDDTKRFFETMESM